MDNLPLISVIIATKNSAGSLPRALQSYIAQSYSQKELLIIDGQSSDQTQKIIEDHKPYLAFSCSEPDVSVYEAWNKAIQRAQGEWIYFLGSDDFFWKDNSLQKAAERLQMLPAQVGIAYGQVPVVSKNGKIVAIEGEPWSHYARRARHEMVIPHQGTFHRRSLFGELGLFNPKFKICGDFEFVLRELKRKRHPVFLDHVVVAGMSLGGLSSSLDNTSTIISELGLARKLNGLRPISRRILMRHVRYQVRKNLNRFLGESITHQIADLYRRAVGKPPLWSRKDL